MKLKIGSMVGDDYMDLLEWLDVEDIDYKAYYTSGSGWFTVLEVADDIATIIKLKFEGVV
jgi:hypothetical protein